MAHLFKQIYINDIGFEAMTTEKQEVLSYDSTVGRSNTVEEMVSQGIIEVCKILKHSELSKIHRD